VVDGRRGRSTDVGARAARALDRRRARSTGDVRWHTGGVGARRATCALDGRRALAHGRRGRSTGDVRARQTTCVLNGRRAMGAGDERRARATSDVRGRTDGVGARPTTCARSTDDVRGRHYSHSDIQCFLLSGVEWYLRLFRGGVLKSLVPHLRTAGCVRGRRAASTVG
jgi:hypothetical protein